MIIDPYTWHRLTIEAIEPVAEATVVVRLKRPNSYVFRAGQYAVVRVTNGTAQVIRQYSFSSAPESEWLELLIQREPGGEVTGWFHEAAKPGDTIELSQPFGKFTLEPSKRPVLCIAGRVGIAPFLSMLRDKPQQPVHLLYSVKHTAQICYEAELKTYDTSVIVTDVSPRIDASTLAPLLADNPSVYLCGSKQFVDAMAALVYKMGVDIADTHRELFTLQ